LAIDGSTAVVRSQSQPQGLKPFDQMLYGTTEVVPFPCDAPISHTPYPCFASG